jgi:hypothetical protein
MLAAFDVASPLNFIGNSAQHIDVSPDGQFATFTVLTDQFTGESAIGLIDLQALRYEVFPLKGHGVKVVTFSQDNTFMSIGSYDQEGLYDHMITFIDVEDKEILQQLTVAKFTFNISFNPSSTLMAILHSDFSNTQVEIWAVAA